MVLTRYLLVKLRGHKFAKVAPETGLEHRPVTDGQRVGVIY